MKGARPRLSSTVVNCIFTENHAIEGGAISNRFQFIITVTNYTFSGNYAGEGKADIDTDNTSRVMLSKK